REMSQIHALVEIIVPDWFRKNSLPFRIWSAACATGEEPYTIAIALNEAGWADHPIEIIGSDASILALEKAQKAHYRERSLRSLPENLRRKYFTEVDKGFQLSTAIMSRVQFHKANILDPREIAIMVSSPVVFCRNVFIYFSPD